MVLQEPDKMRARIHMGVPVLGVQDSGFALGYRFTNVMGLLEYRMNQLQPHEYSRIVGVPVAALQLLGSVTVGATVSITIPAFSATPITYTIVSGDLAGQPDPVFSVAHNLASLVTQTTAGAYIASAQPTVVWPITTWTAGPSTWQIAIISQAGTAFTVTFASSNASLTAYVLTQGVAPHPTFTFAETQQTATGYLAICDYLESQVASASDLTPKFLEAEVKFRPNELDARDANYQYWRQRLADFLGIPLYPMPGVGNFGGSGTGLAI